MAYDTYQADRIHKILSEQKANFYAKKMMGGLVFMVNDKMACGTHIDKKTEMDLLMVRIGPDASETNKDKTGFMPMDFNGRAMKGYAFINPDGFDMDEDLEYWIKLTLDFNPFAKASKKRINKANKTN